MALHRAKSLRAKDSAPTFSTGSRRSPGRRGMSCQLSPERRGVAIPAKPESTSVIPANAGIQEEKSLFHWVPAFAETTRYLVPAFAGATGRCHSSETRIDFRHSGERRNPEVKKPFSLGPGVRRDDGVCRASFCRSDGALPFQRNPNRLPSFRRTPESRRKKAFFTGSRRSPERRGISCQLSPE